MTTRMVFFCLILGLSGISLIPTLQPAETLQLSELTACVSWLDADIRQRELLKLPKIRMLVDFDTYSKLVFLLGQQSATYNFSRFYLETMTPSLYTSLTDGRSLDAFDAADRDLLAQTCYVIFLKSTTQPYMTIGWQSYAPIGPHLAQLQTLNEVTIRYEDSYLVILDIGARARLEGMYVNS
jgi:hypothetical protein